MFYAGNRGSVYGEAEYYQFIIGNSIVYWDAASKEVKHGIMVFRLSYIKSKGFSKGGKAVIRKPDRISETGRV